jgi:hypothetical protein
MTNNTNTKVSVKVGLQQIIAELNEMAKANEQIAIANVIDMLNGLAPTTGFRRGGRHAALKVFGAESFADIQPGTKVTSAELFARYNEGIADHSQWKSPPLKCWRIVGINVKEDYTPGAEGLVFVGFDQGKYDAYYAGAKAARAKTAEVAG